MKNKQKAIELLNGIETRVPLDHINEGKYIQHNLNIGEGHAGLEALFSQLPKGSTKVNIIRAFEDGDYAFCHVDYNFFGPKIGFDIFRFEEGKAVEHWDNLQETSGPNPSGHTMTDGTTTITDPDKTEANKVLARSFVEDILVNGKMDKLTHYIDGENYTQHNPQIGDGLSGLGKALEYMASQGITMQYDTIHLVLGEGNFVLTASEGKFGGKHTSFYDLFRIENGKIVEHWDTIEEIPAKENWKNNNGKF
ncbi:nuclear transport factor 2 family protein [Chryseobacterium sp. YR221]|jgi:predicted SnoaL-like aldol condensation-catalyzing enzyme|uniref:nuclear transport factor 2 family protein n=1 Tax=Chryseobacterium sp. YR221 TaxID=1500293 RepID=UPI0009D8FA65|nr:nuclear transport factor 2 family protein [Chryseobacterium sp. YR221]SMC31467.1 Predicted SnoaL-like aldol condensation-catalyzing enzyme [Chryseobacterium sp. YR221]